MATPDYQEPNCAQPSVEERLQRLQGHVNALYRLLPDELERRLEGERKARWHATYNAALTGLLGGSPSNWELVAYEKLLGAAELIATSAHGPLEPAGER